MSSVTMCDFCTTTSRSAAETVKLDLPRAVVPEALHQLAANATAATIKLDMCHACEGELGELLDAFALRRFAGGAAPGGAA